MLRDPSVLDPQARGRFNAVLTDVQLSCHYKKSRERYNRWADWICEAEFSVDGSPEQKVKLEYSSVVLLLANMIELLDSQLITFMELGSTKRSLPTIDLDDICELFARHVVAGEPLLSKVGRTRCS